MAFTNFNPPFTNKTLEDFFSFQTEYTDIANDLRDWILETYPDLCIGLSYHVPFLYVHNKKLCYFHYYKNKEGALCLELSFVKGSLIKDEHNMFQRKNKETKAIIIKNTKPDFLRKLQYYIDTAIQIHS